MGEALVGVIEEGEETEEVEVGVDSEEEAEEVGEEEGAVEEEVEEGPPTLLKVAQMLQGLVLMCKYLWRDSPGQ